MRALVTGAAGFLGRHVVPLLATEYDTVIAVSRTPGRTSTHGNVRWVTGDLLDTGSLDAIIERERPTHLLHLAWITEPGVYWTSPENARWAARTGQLFDNFFGAGGVRAVGAGSCAEYDWSVECVDDSTPTVPRTPYGVAKHEAHQSLARAATRADGSYGWGRVHFLHGPGEPASRLVPSLARRLLRAQTALCRKPGLLRDWLHVSDVAAAFVALLGASIEGAYNIVSGTTISSGELAQKIAKAAGHPECLELGDATAAPGEPLEIRGSAGELAAHWSAQLSLDEGIQRTVDALRAV